MDKNELRRRILARRNGLDGAERAKKNEAIFRNLVSIPQVQAAGTFLLYLDFRGEVETARILQWGWQAGKRMAVPVTVPAERKLVPVEIRSFTELEPGAYGIREPKAGGRVPVPVDTIDAVLVPGVAFDRRGGRLGYGGGYYDRFLLLLRSDALKIGLAYELQLVEEVPAEEHDVQLDLLVTENAVVNCR
ncbi:5-formyltetrahydrofolate cyclo-ligase [Effusibacillus pohliae]|uniref:5-formyltetrahydrofolate cyclo-ligase n=1 Tax=Effusibacillus pohliae TaxID=232270 RepID=UPI00037AA71C|nr:5-formyltetrahydrofolate cyclo-ligase [Effusibacillus pohliae]